MTDSVKPKSREDRVRTEVVKIIKSLRDDDVEMTTSYLLKLKENYDSGQVGQDDIRFARRVLNLFFDDEEYDSGECCLD